MLDVLNPFSGEVIQSLPMNTLGEAQQYLQMANDLSNNKNRFLPIYQRITILEKLAGLIFNASEALARMIATEGGKPLADARVEVFRAIEGIKQAIGVLPDVLAGKEVVMGLTAATQGRRSYTRKEPVGVVLAYSAFNHPLNLIVHQVVPALAVGCPVIIKPAMTTPLTCMRFCELLKEAGLPDDWCQVLVCDNSVARALVASDKIDFFSFIGSPDVGWMLKSALSPGVRCVLEHGGAAPVIVDSGPYDPRIITSLLKGSFYHAGQVCVSVQRIFVPEADLNVFCDAFLAGVNRLRVDDPCCEKTEVGPLISRSARDRVHQWVSEAQDEGAQLLCGGHTLLSASYAPTVLLAPSRSSRVTTQEIFGPVVSIYPYSDIDDAITQANACPYVFQAAVFTDSLSVAERAIDGLNATAVMVNDHTAFRADWMPFGGRGVSGYGVGGIPCSMRDMLNDKLVVTHAT